MLLFFFFYSPAFQQDRVTCGMVCFPSALELHSSTKWESSGQPKWKMQIFKLLHKVTTSSGKGSLLLNRAVDPSTSPHECTLQSGWQFRSTHVGPLLSQGCEFCSQRAGVVKSGDRQFVMFYQLLLCVLHDTYDSPKKKKRICYAVFLE